MATVPAIIKAMLSTAAKLDAAGAAVYEANAKHPVGVIAAKLE